MNSLGLGFIFVGVGISFSAYHLNRIIGKVSDLDAEEVYEMLAKLWV